MSPASYQTAPPRADVCPAASAAPDPFVTLQRCPESGKRDSNPRPQPWQGCALPTELFPRTANLTPPTAPHYPLQSGGQPVGRSAAAVLGRTPQPPVRMEARGIEPLT